MFPLDNFRFFGYLLNMKTLNFFEEQQKNAEKTFFIIVIFFIILGTIGFFMDHFYLRSKFPLFTILALTYASIHALIAYFHGDKIVLASFHTKQANPDNYKEKVLIDVVNELHLAAGLPMPKVYIIPDNSPNAFATGRNPEHSSIAVTQGLLNSMERDELQGVIGHEMGHIRNRDIRTMTLLAVIFGAIVVISDWLLRITFWGGRGRDRENNKGGGYIVLIAIGLAILSIIISQIMYFFISRTREYSADAASAEFTRNPLALASALRKISEIHKPVKFASRGTAPLFIINPLRRKLENKENFFSNLFATHPPLAARIKRLEAMALRSGK